MGGYVEFAQFYDRLTENIDYCEMAEYYIGFIRKHKGKGLLLDLACGTGSLTIALKNKGFEVWGADSSAEMLSIAQGKDNPDIFWLCQDMTRLNLSGKIGICTCALDSFNHLPSKKAFAKSLAAIARNMDKGGLLLFDVNSPFKHESILADNTFVYDLGDIFCVWENEFSKRENRVDISLNIFSEGKNGKYSRTEEFFSERAYPMEEIVEMLAESGFKLLEKREFLKKKAAAENNEKWFFAARKI